MRYFLLVLSFFFLSTVNGQSKEPVYFSIKVGTVTYPGLKEPLILPEDNTRGKMVIVDFGRNKVRFMTIPEMEFTIMGMGDSQKTDEEFTIQLKCIDSEKNACNLFLTAPFDIKKDRSFGVVYPDKTFIFFLSSL